jgi:hypothetical protein
VPVGTSQNRFYFCGTFKGLRHIPLRQDASVNHEHILFMHGQVLMAQPVNQFMPIWCLQNIGNSVALFEGLKAQVDGHQMQVMVAKQAPSTATQALEASQDPEVVWPSVDQVPQKKYCVFAGGKAHMVEPLLQSAVAALYVANQVKCHGMIVLDSKHPQHDRLFAV